MMCLMDLFRFTSLSRCPLWECTFIRDRIGMERYKREASLDALPVRTAAVCTQQCGLKGLPHCLMAQVFTFLGLQPNADKRQ